jgi:hypothetical protein
MVSAISAAAQTQPVAQPAKPAPHKPIQAKPQSVTATDSVRLSQAAQIMAAALQEATETPAQTAKEAGNGDLQAQRLLAREAAAKPAAE